MTKVGRPTSRLTRQFAALAAAAAILGACGDKYAPARAPATAASTTTSTSTPALSQPSTLDRYFTQFDPLHPPLETARDFGVGPFSVGDPIDLVIRHLGAGQDLGAATTLDGRPVRVSRWVLGDLAAGLDVSFGVESPHSIEGITARLLTQDAKLAVGRGVILGVTPFTDIAAAWGTDGAEAAYQKVRLASSGRELAGHEYALLYQRCVGARRVVATFKVSFRRDDRSDPLRWGPALRSMRPSLFEIGYSDPGRDRGQWWTPPNWQPRACP